MAKTNINVAELVAREGEITLANGVVVTLAQLREQGENVIPMGGVLDNTFTIEITTDEGNIKGTFVPEKDDQEIGE